MRFGFVGTSATANLEDAVLLECLCRGIIPGQHHSSTRQVNRELSDPGSELHVYEPDVVVVAASPNLSSRGAQEPGEEPEVFVESLVAAIRAFRSRSSGILLVHSFVAPEFQPPGVHAWDEAHGLTARCARLNLALSEQLRSVTDAHVVDVLHLVALSGPTWWTLHRNRFMADLAFSEEMTSLLAREYASAGAVLRGLSRKCLVLDLDDTLWGGVLGEVGTGGIQIGSTYPGNIFRAIQQIACELNDDGVLLAINSHNNADEAWEPFDRRADMVLRRRHFAAHRINWQDKTKNIRELADELRLGLDSFVMLDNDAVHRAWVEEHLPEVHVINAEDPLDMLRALATQRLFEGAANTAEDRLRSRSYSAAGWRQQAEIQSADRLTFLRTLDMAVTVGRATPEHLPRLAQLSQRTNQFNVTTRRYTEMDLQVLSRSPEVEILWCSARDRFHDEGMIGLAILRGPGVEWSIDTFLLSCRVLGRGVERAFVAGMCRIAFERGICHLRGEYRRTPRNTPAATFFGDAGFSSVPSDADYPRWHLQLPADDEMVPPWITLGLAGERR